MQENDTIRKKLSVTFWRRNWKKERLGTRREVRRVVRASAPSNGRLSHLHSPSQ